ncbi:hypothetical protein L209DRAFT_746720 [Thermothelomyces heterothallicus CBS 203.75]
MPNLLVGATVLTVSGEMEKPKHLLYGLGTLIDNRSSTSSEEAIAVDVNTAGLLVPRDSLGLPTGLPRHLLSRVYKRAIGEDNLHVEGELDGDDLLDLARCLRGEGEIEKSGLALDLEDQAKIVLNGVKDRANLVTTAAKSIVSTHVDLKFCRDLLELVLVDFALLTKRRNVEIQRALAKNLGPYYYGCLYTG